MALLSSVQTTGEKARQLPAAVKQTLLMTAKEYWEQDGCRLLAEGNRPPTVEERVKEAFVAGFVEGIEHSLQFDDNQQPS